MGRWRLGLCCRQLRIKTGSSLCCSLCWRAAATATAGINPTHASLLPGLMMQVWKKGVCSDTFHPRFRCAAMRERLSGGHPDAPLLVCVGRLGAEKNLKFLKARQLLL